MDAGEPSGRTPQWWQLSGGRYPITLAIGLLAVLIASVTIDIFSQIVNRHDGVTRILGGAGLLILVLVVQARHCQLALTGTRSSTWVWTFPAQIVLTYLPVAAFGATWIGTSGLLVGSWLLLEPIVWRWVGFTLAVVAQVVLSLVLRSDPAWLPVDVASTMATGLLLYGIIRLADLAIRLLSTRMQMIKVAVAGERERFARDLHDLLGQRLSVIALRSELAQRHIDTDPHGAGLDVAEILRTARDAESDVRAVAHGYPQTSLQAEFASTHSVLEAAGVRCRINVSCREIPPHLSDLFGKVLREGVTNVLRHSTPSVCEIELLEYDDRVTLSLSNDGVAKSGGSDPSGTGIPNLRERAAAVGGRVTARHGSEGRFHLVVDVPLEMGTD